MTTRPLNCGQFLGAVRRQLRWPGVVATDTRHPPDVDIPTHAHRNAYFCLVRRGRYRERYGRRTRECGPGTVAFHPPEELHSERTGAEEVLSLNVEVDAGWLARVRDCAPALGDPADAAGGRVAWLAAQLDREFRRPDDAAPLAVEGLLLEIVAELTRSAARRPGTPHWLRRVTDLVQARFREPLTLRDLAAEAGVHPVHLAAVFRQRVGCPVGEYVRRCRVDHAAARLARPGASLAEVALDAGFADQSHFTRVFKRLTGKTPAAYRRELPGRRAEGGRGT